MYSREKRKKAIELYIGDKAEAGAGTVLVRPSIWGLLYYESFTTLDT